jgi:NADH dehydrogenase (ubiquinone) Fe-S protein 6
MIIAVVMSISPPETIRVSHRRVSCDGSGDIPAALGHPRVYLEMGEAGYVDCGYCDRRFVLMGGPADGAPQGELQDISSGASH